MPSPQIAFLAPHRHPRLRYVLKELSADTGYNFRLFTDLEKWTSADAAARIKYGEAAGAGLGREEQSEGYLTLNLPAHPFLSGTGTTEKDLQVDRDRNGFPQFFSIGARQAGSYDLLACAFYCLSRYEEYNSPAEDKHGRFPANAAHAEKNGYLHLPVVRHWFKKIATELRAVFPDIPEPNQAAYYFQPTYDVDMLWAYRHRGLRGQAAGARDVFMGELARAFDRWISKEKDDPYDKIDYLLSLHHWAERSRAGDATFSPTKPQFFWLVANADDHRDPNPYPIPKAQHEVMRSLLDRTVVGLHPSYRSSDQPELIKEELERLQAITDKRCEHSRQHFLRFRLPGTYRELHRAGIRHEHTMGYADAIGWRAGTNQPFYWYDVEREEATYLRLYPFAAMDVTLKNYLELGPEEAYGEIIKLRNGMLTYGGAFTLLWHNSSFAPLYGWKGWQEIYERLVQELT